MSFATQKIAFIASTMKQPVLSLPTPSSAKMKKVVDEKGKKA